MNRACDQCCLSVCTWQAFSCGDHLHLNVTIITLCTTFEHAPHTPTCMLTFTPLLSHGLAIKMADSECVDAVSYADRLSEALKKNVHEEKVQRQQRAIDYKDRAIGKLERELKVLHNNYYKVCSENRSLNAKFASQRREEEQRKAHNDSLKEARDKERVEEEERQAVRERSKKRRCEQREKYYEQFLEFKRSRNYSVR